MTQSGSHSAAASDEMTSLKNLVIESEKAANSILKAIQVAKKENASWLDAPATARMLSGLQQQLGALSSLRASCDSLEALWAASAQRHLLELEGSLKDACTQHGWRLDGEWPTFYVERGIAVVVDEKKRSATVGGLVLESASLMQIVTALIPRVRELVPPTFSVESFISTLAGAYDEVRREGTQVAIYDVYRQFVARSQKQRFWRDANTKDFVGIGIDQFRARFSQTLEERRTAAPDGRELRLLPPLSAKDGLFLYQPAEQRFGWVGRIEFVRQDRGTAT
jgi:hypothetical protein